MGWRRWSSQGSDGANGLDRIEVRRPPRGRECGDDARQRGDQHGLWHQPGADGDRKQSRPRGVEHIHQTRPEQRADGGADQPEHPTLDEKHRHHAQPGGAHGAQDADFACALHHADRQHAGDAQRHRQGDGQADDVGGQRL